jgi:hypothetical protein
MRQVQALVVVFFVGVLALIAGTARAAHGTYLPSAPFGLGSPLVLNVTSWTNTDANTPVFARAVSQEGTPVGNINFNYDTYTGAVAAGYANTGATAVGAGLSGGFNIGAGVTTVPGFTLAWAQVVSPATTIPGANQWNSPQPPAPGAAFPDTSNTTSPSYAFLTVAAGPAPTIGFQDFPFRYPSSGNQTWLAEDALVGINTTTDTMRIVGSFLWGFGVTMTPAGVTANAPSSWGPVTTTFDSTETNAFSATGINGVSGTTWTIQNDLALYPVFAVPEPATVGLLLVVGLAGLSLRPKRAAA